MSAITRGHDQDFKYDVCLSFAGEDRQFVEDVASRLADTGIRLFYDRYEQVDLWGKDLYVHLDYTYRKAARYCVLFVSEHYAKKIWTNHERESAQARALQANEEYVLPAIFDDTELPGLRPTIGHIDLRRVDADALAQLIRQKVGNPRRENYFPPNPDRLYKSLEVKGTKSRRIAYDQAYNVYESMTRMSVEERLALFHLAMNGCPADLPKNFHASVDLVHRYSGLAQAEVLRNLGNLRPFGIYCRVYEDRSHGVRHSRGRELGEGMQLVALRWDNMSTGQGGGNITQVAYEVMWCAAGGYCHDHGEQVVAHNLDFGQLSSATLTNDPHG